MSISLITKKQILAAFAIFLSLLLFSCGGGSGSSDDDTDDTDTGAETDTDDEDTTVDDPDSFPVDTTRFDLDSLASIEEVDCTLSNGDESTCYSIEVTGFPADRDELGYFCPESETAEADEAGKWFDDGVLYDLTGEFIANLSTFYDDDTWNLLNDDGTVKITDTQESCEAAARPDVDEQYQNHCVMCELSYYVDVEGEGFTYTVEIPTTPVPRTDGTGQITNPGIAYNGVKLEGNAPVAAILGAWTIAAFDDCVGHVNPNEGYHYHGANHGDGDCPGVEYESDGHAGAFGYALDGYAIHSMLDESGEEESDLDECRGHTDDERGYHYHSAGPGENTFIGCFTGEIANAEDAGSPP